MNDPHNIQYKSATATPAEIEAHLKKCDTNFVTSLSQKVDLGQYAVKIKTNAVTFEAWEKEQLVGLIAAYFNDEEKRSGYITNVSTVKNHEGSGIGTQLMNNCINYAIKNNYFEIALEVNTESTPAIKLYNKFGFVKTNEENGTMRMKLNLKKAE
jgi:ribosomal protein S18 acetylase RimI-like enzyme